MKWIKRLLSAGGLLFGVGLIVLLLGILLGGSVSDVRFGGALTFSGEYRGAVGVDIDLPAANVTVTQGDVFEVRCYNLPQDFFSVSVKNNIVRVRQEEVRWREYLSVKGVPRLEITCPASTTLDRIRVRTAVGKTSVDGVYVKQITVKTGVGAIAAENVVSLGTKLDIGLGGIVAAGSLSGENVLHCGAGYIHAVVLGDPAAYGVQMDNALGMLRFNEDGYSGFGNDLALPGSGTDRFDIQCTVGKGVLELYPPDDLEELAGQYGAAL